MIDSARFHDALDIVRKTTDYEIASTQYDVMSAICKSILWSKWHDELDEVREKLRLLLRLKIEAEDFESQRQRFLSDAVILDPIKSVIAATPGILQSELLRMSFGNFETDEVRSALYRAAQSGGIRREKNGRTYRLFLEIEKTPSSQAITKTL